MDAKDLSKLPRNAQMLQLAQMGRRKRVSRQDHEQRSSALENLTNRILTPRKVTKKDEVNTPEKKLQSVLQTPRKVAKMVRKKSQELQSVIQSPPQTPLAKSPPSPEQQQQTPLAKTPPGPKIPPVKQKTPPTKQTNPKKRIKTGQPNHG